MLTMWTCPICKTTNETNKCRSCGFDLSKDYTTHRSLCQFSKSSSKISQPVQIMDNVLMASDDWKYVFGRKMDRKQIATIYFQNKKENIGEDAWDVSEKQNGSIMAWTEERQDGLLDLYIAANGNIMANRNCISLFCNYRNVENIFGLKFLKTDRTEVMLSMFYNCNNLKSLNVSHFDTSHVLGMDFMFNQCESLESLDVSHFVTSQVTTMRSMFENCVSLKGLDVSHFSTSQVSNMQNMFKECKSLKILDVSNFDTSCVKDLSVPLPEYLAVPQGVRLKTKKQGGLFRELWGD